MLSDVNQIDLPITSLNYNLFWVNLPPSMSRKNNAQEQFVPFKMRRGDTGTPYTVVMHETIQRVSYSFSQKKRWCVFDDIGWYLKDNFCQIFIKHVVEAILMSTHSIGYYEEISKIIPDLSSNTHLISYSELFSTRLL